MTRFGLTVLVLALMLLPLTPGARADEATVDGRVTVNPLEVSLHLVPDQVKSGETAAAVVLVRNAGDDQLTGLEISLRFEPVSVSAIPLLWAPSATLDGGGLAWQAWAICARGPGHYMVLATVTAIDGANQEIRAESKARLLTVKKGNGRCPPGR